MRARDIKLEKVKEAINALFSDTIRSRSATRRALVELADEIEAKLETLDQTDEDEQNEDE